jgi:putative aldouronate transport system substrate-binding protein
MEECMRNTFARALAALILCGLFSACSPKPATTSSGGASDGIVTITWLVPEYGNLQYPRNWDRPGMAAFRAAARDRFQLNVELEEVLGDEMRTILATRMAAGGGLPDVISYRYSPVELNEVYRNGHILNLSQYARYIPNTLETFELVPSLKLFNTSSEGDILRIPQVVFNTQHITWWANIRKDWLDALGLPLPATMDEYRNALRAFQANDMNKSGRRDEAMVANFEVMNAVLGPAFGALGMRTPGNSWYVDANGKVYHSMLTSQARDYVEYITSLYAEGLIWTSSFASTSEEARGFVNQNNRSAFFGAYWDPLLQNLDAYSNGRTDEYINLLPLRNGSNTPLIMKRNYEGGSNTIMLSSNCKVPERVVSFVDWFQSYEGTMTDYYGETYPGGNYYRADEEAMAAIGIPSSPTYMVLTEKGLELAQKEPDIQAYLGVNYGMGPHRFIDSASEIAAEFYYGFDRSATRSASDVQMNLKNLGWPDIEGNYYYELPLATASDAQGQVISEAADLFSYMDEMYKKFMTGVEPLSNWNNFLDTCNRIGLDKVLAVQQARYDAYKAMN